MILCGYMVQELLCNHLVAPIFGSPQAMSCRNLFLILHLEKMVTFGSSPEGMAFATGPLGGCRQHWAQSTQKTQV